MMMLIYLTWDFIFMDIHFFHAYVLFFMHMHNSLYTVLPYHDLRHLYWQYEQFQLIPWKQDIHIDQSVGMHTLKRNTKVPDRKKLSQFAMIYATFVIFIYVKWLFGDGYVLDMVFDIGDGGLMHIDDVWNSWN